MSVTRIVGLMVLAVGIVLLLIGLNAAQSVGEQFQEALTGKFSQGTTWYLVGGVAAIVGGIALALSGRRTTP